MKGLDCYYHIGIPCNIHNGGCDKYCAYNPNHLIKDETNEMKFTDMEIVDAYEFFIEKYDNLRVDIENFDNDYDKNSEYAKKQLKHYEVAKYAIKQLFNKLI